MARNKNKFANDIKEALIEAETEASKISFSMNGIGENDSVETIAQKVANATANKFAEVLAPKLQKAIDEHIDSLEFNVSGLANSGGVVTGILKIIP